MILRLTEGSLAPVACVEDEGASCEMASSCVTSIVYKKINEAVNGFVGELGRSKWSVTIKKCCPSVIEKLIKEGFMLSMTATGLHIDKV